MRAVRTYAKARRNRPQRHPSNTMLGMTKDDTKKLRSCIDLLDLYGTSLWKSLEDGGQAMEPPAVAILRAFAFGRATLKAIIVVADQGDEECGVCLPTLCRPFFELAVRVLWASRQPDGWERLQRHYAEQDEKWAKRAVEIPAWANYARPFLANAKNVLGRTDIKGNSYTPAPTMVQSLQQVEKHDVDFGFKTRQEDVVWFEYAHLWRVMCGTAHAHVVQIARSPAAHTRIAVGGALVATFALLRATAVFTAPDKEGIIEAVGLMVKKMIRILKGEVLGLDDVVFTRVPPDPA